MEEMQTAENDPVDSFCLICCNEIDPGSRMNQFPSASILDDIFFVLSNYMKWNETGQRIFQFEVELFPFCDKCTPTVQSVYELNEQVYNLLRRIDQLCANVSGKILLSQNKCERILKSKNSEIGKSTRRVKERDKSSCQFDEKKVCSYRDVILKRFTASVELSSAEKPAADGKAQKAGTTRVRQASKVFALRRGKRNIGGQGNLSALLNESERSPEGMKNDVAEGWYYSGSDLKKGAYKIESDEDFSHQTMELKVDARPNQGRKRTKLCNVFKEIGPNLYLYGGKYRASKLEEDKYECLEYHTVCHGRRSITVHLKSHLDKGRFPCSVCGRGFTRNTHRVKHERLHSMEKTNQCRLCDKKYWDLKSLNKHVKEVHGDTMREAEDNPTLDSGGEHTERSVRPMLGKTLANFPPDDERSEVSDLTDDIEIVSDSGVRPTDSNSRRKDEIAHEDKVNDESEKANLIKVDVHDGSQKEMSMGKEFSGRRPRNIKLTEVGSNQFQYGDKHRFEAVHSSLFKCLTCGRYVRQKQSMLNHIYSTHIKQTPVERRRFTCFVEIKPNLFAYGKYKARKKQGDMYECLACHSVRPGRRSIRDHLRNHLDENKHACSICGNGFSRKQHLRVHQQRVHTNEKPFQCQICGFKIASKYDLTNHSWRKHGVSPPTVSRDPSKPSVSQPVVSELSELTKEPRFGGHCVEESDNISRAKDNPTTVGTSSAINLDFVNVEGESNGGLYSDQASIEANGKIFNVPVSQKESCQEIKCENMKTKSILHFSQESKDRPQQDVIIQDNFSRDGKEGKSEKVKHSEEDEDYSPSNASSVSGVRQDKSNYHDRMRVNKKKRPKKSGGEMKGSGLEDWNEQSVAAGFSGGVNDIPEIDNVQIEVEVSGHEDEDRHHLGRENDRNVHGEATSTVQDDDDDYSPYRSESPGGSDLSSECEDAEMNSKQTGRASTDGRKKLRPYVGKLSDRVRQIDSSHFIYGEEYPFERNFDGTWSCETCGMVFKRKAFLEMHLLTSCVRAARWKLATLTGDKFMYAGRGFQKLGENEFKCDVCQDLSPTLEKAMGHIRMRHATRDPKNGRITELPSNRFKYLGYIFEKCGDNQYKCADCPEVYDTLNQATGHIRSYHVFGPARVANLEVLEVAPNRFRYGDTHEFEVVSDHLFKCITCGNYSPTRKGMKQHILYFHIRGKNLAMAFHRLTELSPNEFIYADKYKVTKRGEEFECQECLFVTKSRIMIMQHLRHRHLNAGRFKCATCGEGFPGKYYLSEHERKHKNEVSFVCETCGATFVNNTSLQAHIYNKHKTKKHGCTFCAKAYSVPSELKHHMRVHTGILVEPVVCEVCGKTVERHRLSQHNASHERKYSCAQCRKTFVNKSTLEAHMRAHAGVKPYKCELCDKVYAQMAGLKWHQHHHHSEYSAEYKKTFRKRLRKPGTGPHPCDICGKGFWDKRKIEGHKVRYHSELTPELDRQLQEKLSGKRKTVPVESDNEYSSSEGE